MENPTILAQTDYDFLMQLFSAVLDRKAAHLSVQILKKQEEPREKTKVAEQHLLDCEQVLSANASSKMAQRLFLASQGLYPVSGAEAITMP